MSTFDWPANLIPQQASIGLQKAVIQWRSPFNGTAQVVDFNAERWRISLTLPPMLRTNSGAVEALMQRLAGGMDWVRVWHFARPQPVGTMRGSPTITSDVARGATSIAITTTGSSTLKAGDLFGAGGQIFQVKADATATAGAMTVTTVNRVRSAIAGGASVTWDKPTATFIAPSSSVLVAFRPRVMEGVALDLEEIW